MQSANLCYNYLVNFNKGIGICLQIYEKKEKSTFRKIEHHRTETFFLIVRGLEVGVGVRLVSALSPLPSSASGSANHAVLTAIAGKPLYIALFLAALAGIGYLVSQLVRWQPLASSSGIPQITGEIRGHMDAPWWQVLVGADRSRHLSFSAD